MCDQPPPRKVILRLPSDILREAIEAAEREGLTLAEFVFKAVASKVARTEAEGQIAKARKRALSDGDGHAH